MTIAFASHIAASLARIGAMALRGPETNRGKTIGIATAGTEAGRRIGNGWVI